MDRLEEAKGNNLEIWNTLSITSHPARCFLKVTEAHTGKLFLVNYSSDNSPTPQIVTTRQIISFIRSTMTYCHSDCSHTTTPWYASTYVHAYLSADTHTDSADRQTHA